MVMVLWSTDCEDGNRSIHNIHAASHSHQLAVRLFEYYCLGVSHAIGIVYLVFMTWIIESILKISNVAFLHCTAMDSNIFPQKKLVEIINYPFLLLSFQSSTEFSVLCLCYTLRSSSHATNFFTSTTTTLLQCEQRRWKTSRGVSDKSHQLRMRWSTETVADVVSRLSVIEEECEPPGWWCLALCWSWSSSQKSCSGIKKQWRTVAYQFSECDLRV